MARIYQGETFGDIEFFLGARSLCRAVAISSTVTLLKMRMDVFEELHKTLQPLFEPLKEGSLVKAKARREKIMSFIINEETAALLEGNKPVSVAPRNISPSPSKLPPLSLVKATPRNLDAESTNNRVKTRREGDTRRSEPKLSKSEHLHNNAKKLFLDLLKPDVLKKVLKRERGLNREKHYCKKCMGKGHGDDERSIGNDRDSIDDGDSPRRNDNTSYSTYLKRLELTVKQQESITSMTQTSLVTQTSRLVSPAKFSHIDSISLSMNKSNSDAAMKETLMDKLRVRCISKHVYEKELSSASDMSSPTKKPPKLKPIRLTCDVEDPMINLKQLIVNPYNTTYSMKTNYGPNSTFTVRGHRRPDVLDTTDRSLVRIRRTNNGNSPLLRVSMVNKSSIKLGEKVDLGIGINGVMKDIELLKQSASLKRIPSVWIKKTFEGEAGH